MRLNSHKLTFFLFLMGICFSVITPQMRLELKSGQKAGSISGIPGYTISASQSVSYDTQQRLKHHRRRDFSQTYPVPHSSFIAPYNHSSALELPRDISIRSIASAPVPRPPA
jgi:hypothetical protein